MPRKPKPIEERKFPRTTGIPARGECGHEYSKRIPLDKYSGKFRTPENLKAVEKVVRDEQRAALKAPCPTCNAVEVTAMCAQGESVMARWLGVQPLPELTGTPRTIGFAAEIRHNLFRKLLENGQYRPVSLLSGSRVVESLIMDAVLSKWGQDVDSEPSEDISALAQDATELRNAGFYNFYYPTSFESMSAGVMSAKEVRETLTSWLLLKRIVEQGAFTFYDKTEAQFWIRHHKGTQSWMTDDMRFRGRPIAEGLAAEIVAKAFPWNNRDDAYSAFVAMMAYTGTVEADALDNADEGTPLKDMLEQMQVMRALSGKDPVVDWPF